MDNFLYFNVTRLLKQKRMQQKDLAEKMGCSPAFISNALSGNPTIETLQRFATALSVPVSTLLREQEDITGFVEVNGKPKHINCWDDVYELVNAHEKAIKQRSLTKQ